MAEITKSKKGFSRRHETSEEHFAAQAQWHADHDLAKVSWRQAERAHRTQQEQIALLDRRLGVGKGAAKERKRLMKPVPAKKSEPPKPMTKAEIAAGIEAYNPANMW